MMTPRVSKTILIADDDPDLRDILRSVLEPAGFAVAEAADGGAALEAIRARPPDLAILDYTMPKITGPQLCVQLKQDILLRHVPIILLTGKSEIQDKVHGIDSGADDYMVKPFEPRELLARVQMVLRRTAQELEANPLTRLPGNRSIQQELERRLASPSFAACYADLNLFKAFNDHYGFKRGDEVIQRTAEVLLKTTRMHGNPNDFVGHIGGDDFIILTTRDKAEALCEAIIRDFDAMAPQLYDAADRTRGFLLHRERRGQEVKVPFLSIALALVMNDRGQFTHPGQLAAVAAELKAYAKRSENSAIAKERRQDDADDERG